MRTIKAVLVLIIFCFPMLSFGADVAKIGVVNFQMVFDISDKGKAVGEDLKSRGQQMSKELNEKRIEIEKMQKELQVQKLVLSDDKRERKEREINIKLYDLKLLKEKYTAQLKEQEEIMLKKIKKELFALVKKVGEEEGFLIILETVEAGVLYVPKAIDLTDKIILMYNENFAKESKN